MKPMIVGGAAFVIGLAGSTVVSMRAAPIPAPAVVPLSTVAHLTANDSARPPAAGDSASTAAAPAAGVPPVEPPVAAPPPDHAAKSDTARLAALFRKLEPADITPLAARLSDSDLKVILRGVDVTRAAAVLAGLPKERAHVLSKWLLAPAAGSR